MVKYRPIVGEFDAIRWEQGQNDREVFEFARQSFPEEAEFIASLVIRNSVRYAVVTPGDWLIRDENGNIGTCEHDVFVNLYEPVEKE